MTQPTALDTASEPAAGNRCRACDGNVNPASLRCENCGAAYGEHNRCPHCHVIAGTEPASGLGRCRACGELRVALSRPLRTSGREALLFARAGRARRLGILSRLGAVAAGTTALSLLIVVVAVLAQHASLALLVLGGLAMAPLGAALWLERRARRAFGEQRQSFERGLALAARDISTQSPGADAATIARLLGLSLERAQGLVAEIEVEQLLVTPPSTLRLEPAAPGDTLVEPATEPLAPPQTEAARFARDSDE